MKYLVLALFPLIANAHLEPGTYTGTTAERAECKMLVGEQTFLGNKPHPLNERIAISVNGFDFNVGHPVVIDTSRDLVSFNHDFFQGVLPTDTGAIALEVMVSHEPGKEGPTSFTLVENFWKTGKKTALHCSDFTHQN